MKARGSCFASKQLGHWASFFQSLPVLIVLLCLRFSKNTFHFAGPFVFFDQRDSLMPNAGQDHGRNLALPLIDAARVNEGPGDVRFD